MAESDKIDSWDWNRQVPIDIWIDLQIAGFPGWDKVGKVPHNIIMEFVLGRGVQSRDLALEWNNISEGSFYYRDVTGSGLPFVSEDESYNSLFWFQCHSDYLKFKEWAKEKGKEEIWPGTVRDESN